MSNIILSSHALTVPLPKEELTFRPGNTGDIDWIDDLQKHYNKALGFMPRMWLEGKLKANHILIAMTQAEPVGYIIAQDRYFKRDDLGIVYQLVVKPDRHRGFIGAALLKAQFDRSAYGCRMYCCWCAQDLEANHFWESMGFVPLAYRNGAEKKGKNGKHRVHIFWEKKIRGNDDTCHWWFPAKTDAGAMSADRLALPIKPGVHWSEVEPIEIPTIGDDRLIEGTTATVRKNTKPKIKHERAPLTGGLRFAVPKMDEEQKVEKRRPKKKLKAKIDPKFIAASRELRDRYLEVVNEAGYKLGSAGKYELVRNHDTHRLAALSGLNKVDIKLLEAA